MADHWSEEKEYAKTNFPILLTLILVKKLPEAAVNSIALIVSFFYFLFARKPVRYAVEFQKQLKLFTDNKIPEKTSGYKSILSFSLSLIERLSSWTGKTRKNKKIVRIEQSQAAENLIHQKNGAIIFGSHLGNIDFMRSLALERKFTEEKKPVINIIIEKNSSQKFSSMINSINGDFYLNTIDPSEITPATICILQDKLAAGELLFAACDRTSSGAKERTVTREFLGKKAKFPYGVFLMATLLKVPLFYIYGLREKTFMFHSRNVLYVRQSKVNLESTARKERDKIIEKLCSEYVHNLESFCKKAPFQWYNFFDFWRQED